MRFIPIFLCASILLSSPSPVSSQSEATAEAELAFRNAERELTAAFSALLAGVKQHALRRDIESAQRAWLLFRDKEASARAGITSHGGSAYSMDYLANRTELTRERFRQLGELLEKL